MSSNCDKWWSIHDWKYPTYDYRVCIKCGKTEHKTYASAPHDCEYWMEMEFNKWYKEMKHYKDLREGESNGIQEGRIKALEWLSSLEVK